MSLAREFIGRLLLAPPDEVIAAFEAVSPADITDPKLRRIYSGALASWKTHGKIQTSDLFSDPGDKDLMSALVVEVPWVLSLPELVPKIQREGRVAQVKALAVEISRQEDPDTALQLADLRVSELRSRAVEKDNSPRAVWAKVQEKANRNRGKGSIGFSTPFRELTRKTSGFIPGHLWILGGYTSHGKSFVGTEFVYHLIQKGGRPIIFSTEMTVEATLLRIAARHSRIPSQRILLGDMLEWNHKAVDEAFALMAASGLTVYDDVYTVDQMRLKAKRDKAYWEGRLDLVVVDFVQNILGEGTVYERMSRIPIELQRMAKDLDTCVVAMSQISNESARDDSGLLGYKGAGEIAAAADVGLWIKRDGEKLDLLIRKHRHGETGKILLQFEENFTRLTEIPGSNALLQTSNR